VTRYVAFLRAINVGGHTVKMEELRRHFKDFGVEGATTFIASGNVLFEDADADSPALERRIERGLHQALGYEVVTFVRSDEEIAAIAGFVPFPDAAPKPGDTSYVLFLQQAPDAAVRRRVAALSNDADLFRVHERELYWLRRGSLLASTVKDVEIARALGRVPTTSRNLNTVRRLAAKLRPA
jgi:uncharacterized protein (DUF1697 family)